MTKLSTAQIEEVSRKLQLDFSVDWTNIPIGVEDLESLLNLIDTQLESAEVSIVSSLPAGGGKTWLLNNTLIGRKIIVYVEQKRQEVL